MLSANRRGEGNLRVAVVAVAVAETDAACVVIGSDVCREALGGGSVRGAFESTVAPLGLCEGLPMLWSACCDCRETRETVKCGNNYTCS